MAWCAVERRSKIFSESAVKVVARTWSSTRPLRLITCQLIGPFSLLTCPLSLCRTVHCHFLPHTGQHGSNQVYLARFNFTRAALGPDMAAIL